MKVGEGVNGDGGVPKVKDASSGACAVRGLASRTEFMMCMPDAMRSQWRSNLSLGSRVVPR